LAGIYDPLGIIFPTVVEGKHVYREACDENQNWDSEVSAVLAKDWLKWTRQLRNVRIPRSVIRECRKVKAVQLHLFADASNLACSAMTIAVVEHDTGTVKGFLASKSRICKRKHIHRTLGANKWSDGSIFSEEFCQCSEETARQIGYHLDG
jgi:hypothetical protein